MLFHCCQKKIEEKKTCQIIAGHCMRFFFLFIFCEKKTKFLSLFFIQTLTMFHQFVTPPSRYYKKKIDLNNSSHIGHTLWLEFIWIFQINGVWGFRFFCFFLWTTKFRLRPGVNLFFSTEKKRITVVIYIDLASLIPFHFFFILVKFLLLQFIHMKCGPHLFYINKNHSFE